METFCQALDCSRGLLKLQMPLVLSPGAARNLPTAPHIVTQAEKQVLTLLEVCGSADAALALAKSADQN